MVLNKEKTEAATKLKLEKEAKHEKSSSSCCFSGAQQMAKEAEEKAQRAGENLLKEDEEAELTQKRKQEKKAEKKTKTKGKKDSERLEKERVCGEDAAKKTEDAEKRMAGIAEEQMALDQKRKEANAPNCKESEGVFRELEKQLAKIQEQEQAKIEQARTEQQQIAATGAPGAASDTDVLASCHKIGADFKGESTQEKAPMSANALSAEAQFLAKFNLGDSDGGGVSVAVTVADQPHVRGGMNRLRFTYS